VKRGFLNSDDAKTRQSYTHGGGFSVDASVRISQYYKSHKITLGFRLIVCVYHSGKIVVKGKYDAQYGAESMEHLIPLLPPETRWCVNVAVQEPFKTLIAKRKGSVGKR
jgi:hypothetical protein